MKKKILLNIAAITAISLAVLTACNQQDNPNTENSAMENSTVEESANLADLKAELKDVGTEIEQLTAEGTAEFKTEAEILLSKIKNRITTFENQANAAGNEISESTQTAIDSLEQQAVRIESKLKVLGATTEEKAIEFREELKHDFNDLGNSLRNFFNENT